MTCQTRAMLDPPLTAIRRTSPKSNSARFGQNPFATFFEFAPFCTFLRGFAPVLHFFCTFSGAQMCTNVGLRTQNGHKPAILVEFALTKHCSGFQLLPDSELPSLQQGWKPREGSLGSLSRAFEGHICTQPRNTLHQLTVERLHGIHPAVWDLKMFIPAQVSPGQMNLGVHPSVPQGHR